LFAKLEVRTRSHTEVALFKHVERY
jgi:hypothetical protein